MQDVHTPGSQRFRMTTAKRLGVPQGLGPVQRDGVQHTRSLVALDVVQGLLPLGRRDLAAKYA